MLGLIMIRTSEAIRPDRETCYRAGRVEPFPEKRKHDHRQIGRSRHGKSERDQERDIGVFSQEDRDPDRDRADDERGDARHPHFLARRALRAFVNHVGVEIMRKRSRRTDR